VNRRSETEIQGWRGSCKGWEIAWDDIEELLRARR